MNLPSHMKIIRAGLQAFSLCVVPVGLVLGSDIASVERAEEPTGKAGIIMSPRGRLELVQDWLFQPDPWGEGERLKYFEDAFDASLWRMIGRPQGFDRCVPGLESYEGKGWYRCPMRVPAEWKERRVVLRFEGVNYRCRVWLNGQLLGEHADGFLPFEFSVHKHLRFGEVNWLAVLVDNTRLPGEVPGIQRGWRNIGGILREVTLLATDRRWIDDVQIVAEPDGREGKLSVQVRMISQEKQSQRVTAAAQVIDATGRLLAGLSNEPISLPGDEATTVELTGRVAAIEPWSPARPALYKLEVALTSNGKTIDLSKTRFGFRHIERRGTQLLLNGQPLYLTGFNRHEDSPTMGMSTDLQSARQDLAEMKRAGANFVRLCHYPHHPGELDLCDELGLLVMDEIPLWQWDERKEDASANVRKLAVARRQLDHMIARDRNHSSVIFWSVSNENHEQQPRIRAGNTELIGLARQLDPTRLAVHVSSFFWAEGAFDADDVICINGYPNIPIWEVRPGASRDPEHPGAYFRAMLAELHARYPEKPILVTEFGHPCFAGVKSGQLGEDTQARLIADAFSGMDAPYCCGATIWCYADHPWPEEPYFHALMMSNFGVVTRDRHPRRAFAAVQRMFTERGRSRSVGGTE